MTSNRLQELIDKLLADSVGRVFAINTIDHVEIGHLDREFLSGAWRHLIDVDTSNSRDAAGIIQQLQKWPGPNTALAISHPACWLQGKLRPDELASWSSEDLVNVCPSEYVSARSSADSTMSGTLRTRSNPALAAPRPFLLWLAKASAIPSGLDVDRIRDLLGLMHHMREKRVELALLTFSGAKLSGLFRPTTLETGANARFQACSEEERAAKLSDARKVYMGLTVDLEQVRLGSRPFSGPGEGVALADQYVIADRTRTDRTLGYVSHRIAEDERVNTRFEDWIGNGRSRTVMAEFFTRLYEENT